MSDRVDCINNMYCEQKKENAVLKGRLVDLEDRQRRDNLVFDGIPDGPKETSVHSPPKETQHLVQEPP